MAKTKREEIDWALKLAPEYVPTLRLLEPCLTSVRWISYVYSADEEPGYSLRLPVNKGREAMAYLTFIIDNYDGLPESTVFVHASSVQWHNDIVGDKTANIFKDLRLDTIQRKGYVNLRCHLSPGCPFSVFPLSPSKTDIKVNDVRAYFADIYKELFSVTQEQVPEQIGSVCCAQFALSRDRIRNRPREDYVRMREWAIHTELDTVGVGWVFEMLWHIVFGEKPLQLVRGQRGIEKQIC
ncbi:MAG: hypothetical protein Q9187_005672 [Circinaria calcarea]